MRRRSLQILLLLVLYSRPVWAGRASLPLLLPDAHGSEEIASITRSGCAQGAIPANGIALLHT